LVRGIGRRFGEEVREIRPRLNDGPGAGAVGVKLTLIAQLPPGSTSVPQVLVWLKSPLALIAVMSSGWLPLSVSVTAWGALVVPTAWLPKLRLVGLSVAFGPLVSDHTPRPCDQATSVASSDVGVMASTRTLGSPVPKGDQLPSAGVPPHVPQIMAPASVPMKIVCGFFGSTVILSITRSGTAAAATPVISVHTVPPVAPALVVCQTRAPLLTPIVAQASLESAGLTASPVTQALPVSAERLKAGKLPVISVQFVVESAAAFLETFPNQLPARIAVEVGLAASAIVCR
jgi:hypothetical protein